MCRVPEYGEFKLLNVRKVNKEFNLFSSHWFPRVKSFTLIWGAQIKLK